MKEMRLEELEEKHKEFSAKITATQATLDELYAARRAITTAIKRARAKDTALASIDKLIAIRNHIDDNNTSIMFETVQASYDWRPVFLSEKLPKELGRLRVEFRQAKLS